MKNRLTLYILAGMVLGVAVGYVCHRSAADAAQAKAIAGYFSVVTDIFLRLVKMIIAPLVLLRSSPASPAWKARAMCAESG